MKLQNYTNKKFLNIVDIRLTGHICKSTVNRGKSDMIYTFVSGRPIKDNLLIGDPLCVS